MYGLKAPGGHDISATADMALGAALEKKMAQRFLPNEMIDLRFRGNDLTIKTDEAGRAILLFMGKRAEDGHISGFRYARRLVLDDAGNIIKDHWELKGKST